jgi:hypothetical protein
MAYNSLPKRYEVEIRPASMGPPGSLSSAYGAFNALYTLANAGPSTRGRVYFLPEPQEQSQLHLHLSISRDGAPLATLVWVADLKSLVASSATFRNLLQNGRVAFSLYVRYYARYYTNSE